MLLICTELLGVSRLSIALQIELESSLVNTEVK